MFSDPRNVPNPAGETPAIHIPPQMHEVNSQDLMQGTREIIIRHGDDAYRLSVTRSGKLILRK